MTQNKQQVPALLQELALQIPEEFLVTEFLGEGGHGIVLKAIHKTMQKSVALKIIKTDNSEDTKKQISRMQNEAKILARLEHPNIVKVFQMGLCKDGTPFLICEYLEGITLAQYLSSHPQPSPQAIYEIFSQILEALELAHKNNLLHRDIKPSNVMILKDDEGGTQIKLLDFGIAREFEASELQPLGLTRTIQLSGSAPYMSPEQCKGMKIDQRSDLYSVACMLFECLSGKPPFSGETPMHTRYLQIHEAAQMPESDKYEITASRSAVYKLALQCLSKDANNRPPSAIALKELLQKAMPNALKRNDWTPRKRSQRHRMMTGLVAGLCFLGISVFWVSKYQSPADHEKPPSNRSNSKKTTIRTALSAINRLRDAQDRFKVLNPVQGTSDLKDRISLYDQVSACISEINPANKGVLLSALVLRAELEKSMKLPGAAVDTLNSALALCKDNQAQTTVEACQCYVELADISIASQQYQVAQEYVRKGFALVNEMESNMRALEVPSIIDCREGLCKWKLHQQQAYLYEKEGKAKEAAAEYHETAKLKLAEDKLREAAENFVNEATLLHAVGQANAAEKLLREFFGTCLNGASNDVDEAYRALSTLESHPLLSHYPELKASIHKSKEKLKPQH